MHTCCVCTGLHIDPLWTNAWVTILQGRKRWILFPPNTPHDQIGLCQPQIPSVVWFRDYYARVTAKDWPEEWQPVEVLQSPGETVFVPNGWPRKYIIHIGEWIRQKNKKYRFFILCTAHLRCECSPTNYQTKLNMSIIFWFAFTQMSY